MDTILILIASLLFLPLFTGCVTRSTVPERKNPAPEIMLGNRILDAMRQEDYGEFFRCVGPEIGERVTQERFITSEKELKQKYGEMDSFCYITGFETPSVGNHLWKVLFLRKNKNGKPVRQELMFRLITGSDGTKLKVVSLGFL